MGSYYVLKDRRAVPATMIEWAEAMEARHKDGRDAWRVAWTEIAGGLGVSTVFLGIDHNFMGGGPPLLFETMAFVETDGRDQVRTSTWAEAELAHMEMVEALTPVEALTTP